MTGRFVGPELVKLYLADFYEEYQFNKMFTASIKREMSAKCLFVIN